MSNKNNDLRYQRNQTLRNSGEEFREKASNIEKQSPIGCTSGMGNENYYFNNGVAYNSYEEAVNHVGERLDKENK